jgi:hypothetical protein
VYMGFVDELDLWTSNEFICYRNHVYDTYLSERRYSR